MRSEVQLLPGPPIAWLGALAQLGERLLCKHQVIGSIPISSTKQLRSDLSRSSTENCAAIARSGQFPEMKSSGLPDTSGDMAHVVRLFDIVNGFFNRCRGDMGLVFVRLPQGRRMKVSSMIVHTRLSG